MWLVLWFELSWVMVFVENLSDVPRYDEVGGVFVRIPVQIDRT